MAIQNLRSSDAHKRPIPTVLSAGQIAINTNEASPGLFFKDSNGDLVKVGPVHIGTSAPNSSPATTAADALVSGTVYQILTVGNTDFTAVGASANTVGVVFTATGAGTGTGTVSGQQGNEKGEQWLDTTGGAYDLKIYDGSAWRSQAGEFVNASGDNMTGNLTLGTNKVVLNASSGAGTFAGNVQSGSNPDAGANEGALIRKNGRIQLASNQGSTPLWSGYTVGTSTATSQILADGSATFNSSIQSGEYAAGAAGSIQIFNNTASAQAFKIGNTTNGSNIAMKSDGSATFAGGTVSITGDLLSHGTGNKSITLRRDTARIIVSSDSGSAPVFNGQLNQSTTSTINADGSATFAGHVEIGAPDYTSNSGVGIEGRADGLIRLQRASGSSSAVLQAWRGSLNTATIAADGSATFADDITNGPAWDTSTSLDQAIIQNGAIFSHRSASTSAAFSAFLGSGSNRTVNIKADGSAEFAGLVETDYRFRANRNAYNINDVYLGKVTSNGNWDCSSINSSNQLVWGLGADGSAKFAGGEFVISSTGNLAINRTSGTNDILNGKLNGSVTSTINANGSAEFAGLVTCNDVVASSTNDTFPVFRGLNAAGTATNFRVNGDGSATFAGGYGSSGVSITSDGEVRADSQITSNRTTGVCFSAQQGGSQNASISANGSAYFASDVGIGTTSPVRKLHLHEAGSGGCQQRFTNVTTGTGSSDGFEVGISGGEAAQIWNYEATDMLFGTNNSERMRIASNGNTSVKNASFFHPATNNAIALGTSSLRWSVVYANNGTIQTSDERLKTEIATSSLATGFVKSLRPVSYKWIEGGKQHTGEYDEDGNFVYESVSGARTHWGFIAQEVKQSADDAGVDFGGWVLEDKNDADSTQSLRYDQFIAPLTAALQEAIAKIETLEAKVAALEAG